jgi:hypothetical protein
LRFPQSRIRDTTQISPGKFDRLPRTPAGSTALALDGYGLCDQLPARPTKDASYPISVRQVAVLRHASFRRHLTMTPLRLANPSPPSGWIGDFHPQAIKHAGHTTKPLRGRYVNGSGCLCSPVFLGKLSFSFCRGVSGSSIWDIEIVDFLFVPCLRSYRYDSPP